MQLQVSVTDQSKDIFEPKKEVIKKLYLVPKLFMQL